MDRKELAQHAARMGTLLADLSAEMVFFLRAAGMTEREAAAVILHQMSAAAVDDLLVVSKKEVERKKEG